MGYIYIYAVAARFWQHAEPVASLVKKEHAIRLAADTRPWSGVQVDAWMEEGDMCA
jgi:hypothetical protein